MCLAWLQSRLSTAKTEAACETNWRLTPFFVYRSAVDLNTMGNFADKMSGLSIAGFKVMTDELLSTQELMIRIPLSAIKMLEYDLSTIDALKRLLEAVAVFGKPNPSKDRSSSKLRQ